MSQNVGTVNPENGNFSRNLMVEEGKGHNQRGKLFPKRDCTEF